MGIQIHTHTHTHTYTQMYAKIRTHPFANESILYMLVYICVYLCIRICVYECKFKFLNSFTHKYYGPTALYIYIYILINRQIVSLYHNSSVWLDT